MVFLKLLEGLRTPFWDGFFSLVTRLGEEVLFMALGFAFFWCISKKKGYYILFVGFTGLLCNQFLKIFCRIPRPWVQDPTLTVVGDAKIAATGYSFPSGHTQISVGGYGCVAHANRNRWLKWLCRILCVLIPFSRLYLGVHTPLDVGVSLVLALVLVFAFYPLTKLAMKKAENMRIFMGNLTALTSLYLLFLYLYPFPADTDAVNYASAMENAWKILGALLGAWAAFELDNKYLHFRTDAVWWAQILKLVLGLGLVIALRAALKGLLGLLPLGNTADAIRYFLVIFFACGVWPMTFPLWKKLGKK